MFAPRLGARKARASAPSKPAATRDTRKGINPLWAYQVNPKLKLDNFGTEKFV